MRALPAGLTKVPFGFTQDDKGLVATTSVKTRNERSELGEFAIELFASLGISEDKLLELSTDPNLCKGLQLTTNNPEKMIAIDPRLKEG